jgi:hypothetical protein
MSIINYLSIGLLVFSVFLTLRLLLKNLEQPLLEHKERDWNIKETAYKVQREKDRDYISLLEQLSHVSAHETPISFGENRAFLIKFHGGETSFQHWTRESGNKWTQKYS